MNKSIIFLEPKGTVLEVVRAAHARGYEVFGITSDIDLINKAPNPYRSAAKLLRVIEVSDWTNTDRISQIVSSINHENPIAGIYTGIDPCAALCCHLRKEYGLRTTEPEKMEIVLNKYLLRKALREAGLSKITNTLGSFVDKWTEWNMEGAAYFKPTHGFFSAYVEKCSSLNDLNMARTKWQEGLKNERPFIRNYLQKEEQYHLEQEFKGELLSVEAMSFNGEFHAIGLLSRILYSKNPTVEMGSCFPYLHPLSKQIIELVRSAHAALGITDGPTHTEVIVSSEGKVEIIDLNPRFVGADVLQSINNAFGVTIEDNLVDFAVGVDTKFESKCSQFSCIQYVLPPKSDIFESIEFPDLPEVKFATSLVEPGTHLSSVDRQLDYLGCYLTVMPTFSDAIRRSRELRPLVTINKKYAGEY